MRKLLFVALFIAPLLFLSYRIVTRPKLGVFESRYTNTVAQWNKKQFFPLKPYDALARDLASVPIQGGETLTADLRQSLTNAILGFWKAYSNGSKESYLDFHFPESVPWSWKKGALEKMSNYFVNGIIFDSEYLMDQWMRTYGMPDRMTNFPAYAESARTWTKEERLEIRTRWINKYGDGHSALKAERPAKPFDQWLLIAKSHSGGDWWSNYWTGVCLEEMVIKIATFETPPPPVQKFNFGKQHKRTGYDVDASFPNMGIGRMDRKSYIQWESSYADLIQQNGSVLTANIYCMLSREPKYPQPVLLRLAYFKDMGRWVPMELVDGHIMHTEKQTLYF